MAQVRVVLTHPDHAQVSTLDSTNITFDSTNIPCAFLCRARVEVTTTYPCFFSRYGLATGRSIDRTDTLVLVYFFQTERRLNTITVFMLTNYRILYALIACLTRTTQSLWEGTQRSACLCWHSLACVPQWNKEQEIRRRS